MRLGKYMRDAKSVREEGENLQAVWSPDSKLIAVLVSSLVFTLSLAENLLIWDKVTYLLCVMMRKKNPLSSFESLMRTDIFKSLSFL